MPAKAKSKKVSSHPVEKSPPTAAVVSSPEPVAAPPAKEPVIISAPTAQAQMESPPPASAPAPNTASIEEMLESEPEDETSNRANTFLFMSGGIAAGVIIVAAIFIFMVVLRSSKVTPSTQSVTMTPTPTPTPVFLRTSVTFEVMNASGVPGAAAKVAVKLTDAGYTVITVANRKKQVQTELLLASALTPSAVSEVLSDLQSLFSVASATGILTDSSASARLIIGSK